MYEGPYGLRSGGDTTFISHVSERWAYLVIRVIEAPGDPRTVCDWAEWSNVSTSTLRATCHLAGLSPKRSLNLARLLRAIIVARVARCLLQDLLDVRDPRTLKQLLNTCGVYDQAAEPPTPLVFLEKQKLIPPGRPLSALRQLVSKRLAD